MVLEVYRLLKAYGFKVSKKYLKVKLETHPYYPSILCIKDTLEELNLGVDVFQVEPSNLGQIEGFFLAHIKNKNTEQILFVNNFVKELSESFFINNNSCSGIILTIKEGNKPFGNEENNKNLNFEELLILFKSISILSLLSIIFFGIFLVDFKISHILLIVSNLIGLSLSYFIIEKEFGISNYLSDKICKLYKKGGCETILFSKGAKLFTWLSWGDIGVSYFVASLIYIVFVCFSDGITIYPYFFASYGSIFFMIYSLYYQIKVIKEFCMLCIGIVLTLLLNFLICLYFFNYTEIQNFLVSGFLSIAIFVLISLISIGIWLVLKDILFRSSKNLLYFTLYHHLKRNPQIFLSVMEKEPMVPECIIPSNEPIIAGTYDAPFRLVMACNPYCNPCALAHVSIGHLLNKYPSEIQVAIRFALTEKDIKENTERVMVARHIVKYLQEYPYQTQDILHFWYKEMSKEKLIFKFPLKKEIDVEDILNDYSKWNTELSIKGTPTFWLNEKQLPELFNWVDLFEQLPVIIEDSLV